MWIESKDVNLSLTYGNLHISERTPLVRLPHCTPREALALSRPSDTTVYLTEEDDFSVLQRVLDKWCIASKARFNVGKTEIIPIGNKRYR
ncbi:hypothetical protein FB107DRAFT_222095, partial [Schizophyllum commune]